MKINNNKYPITLKHLGRTNDSKKCMLKSYMLLERESGGYFKSGAYSTFKISSYSDISTELDIGVKKLCDLIDNMLESKEHVLESTRVDYYMGDDLLDTFEEFEDTDYDKIVETKTKTTIKITGKWKRMIK